MVIINFTMSFPVSLGVHSWATVGWGNKINPSINKKLLFLVALPFFFLSIEIEISQLGEQAAVSSSGGVLLTGQLVLRTAMPLRRSTFQKRLCGFPEFLFFIHVFSTLSLQHRRLQPFLLNLSVLTEQHEIEHAQMRKKNPASYFTSISCYVFIQTRQRLVASFN